MSLVERELLTLPEAPSSPPVISGVRVNRSMYGKLRRQLTFKLSRCADTIIVFLNEVLQFRFIGITHLILHLKSCFQGVVVVVIAW